MHGRDGNYFTGTTSCDDLVYSKHASDIALSSVSGSVVFFSASIVMNTPQYPGHDEAFRGFYFCVSRITCHCRYSGFFPRKLAPA